MLSWEGEQFVLFFLSPKSFLLLSLLHAQQLKFESALRSLLFFLLLFLFLSIVAVGRWSRQPGSEGHVAVPTPCLCCRLQGFPCSSTLPPYAGTLHGVTRRVTTQHFEA